MNSPYEIPQNLKILFVCSKSSSDNSKFENIIRECSSKINSVRYSKTNIYELTKVEKYNLIIAHLDELEDLENFTWEITKHNSTNIPILYLTSLNHKEYLLGKFKNEFSYFLIKPVNEKELIQKIESVIGMHSIKLQLKVAQERYKRITDVLTDYLYTVKVKDAKAVQTIHNEQCQFITGYNQSEFAADPFLWINMIPIEEREAIALRFLKILSGSDSEPIEHRIIHKNGSIRWVRNTIIPEYDSSGVLVSYDGVIKDITEKKLLEERLKENEERFRMLFEQAPLGYQSLDENGNILEINKAWLDTLGYNYNEVIGKWFGDFLHPNYQEAFRERFPLFKSLGKINSQFEMLHKDGTYRFISFEGRIGYKNDGSFKQTHCILADMTDQRNAEIALRESEERWKKAIASSPVPIMIHDEADNVLQLSAGWTKYSGYTIQDIPTLGDWTELAYGERIGSKKEYIDNLFSIDQTVSNGEWVIRAKDGSKRIWEFQTTPLGKDFNGNRVLHSLAFDITERKKAEADLKESEAKYHLVFDNSGTSNSIFDTECRLIMQNKLSVESLGIKDAIGKNVFELFGKENGEKIFRRMNQVIKSKEPEQYDTEFNLLTGKKWFRSVYQPLIDRDNTVIGIQIISQDITSAKKAEEEIITQRNTLNTIFESSPYIMLLVDQEGKVVNINKEGVKFAGRDKGLLLNRLEGEVFNCLNSFQLQGCGKNKNCSNCPIKTCVAHTFQTSNSILNSEGKMEFRFQENNVALDLLISTNLVKQDNSNFVLVTILNITELKQAENALRKSEELFKTVVQNSADLTTVTDENDNLIFVSHQCQSVLGINGDEFIGKKMPYNIHPQDLEACFIKWEALKTNLQEINDYEYRIIDLQGNIRWISHSAKIVKVDNKVIGIQSSIRNITDRKIAQEELVMLAQSLKSINECVSITDLNNKILFVNQAFINTYGYSSQELIGQDIKIVSSSKNIGYNQAEILNSTIAGGWNGELINTKKDGTEFPIYLSTTTIKNNDGKVFGLIGVAKDITERKNAERALKFERDRAQNYLDTVETIIVALNTQGIITTINRKGCEVLGYTEEELIGKSWFNTCLPQPEGNDIVYPFFLKSISGEVENIEYFENSILTKDGSQRIIAWHNSLIKDSNNKIIASLSSGDDITERKKTENEILIYRNHLEDLVKARTEELNKVNEYLKIEIEKEKEYELMLQEALEKEKELNEMKSRFISTTSHEFRTPLTSVLSSTELLQRYHNKWSEDKKNEHFNRIQKSVEYLTKLLDDVLTLSRTETGKISYNPELINLKNFADECINDVKSLFSNEHNLLLNYKTKIKEFNLDPKLMKFIFNNLLSNAAKYSPHGGKIGFEISTDRKHLIIKVSDEGIGIPQNDLDRIFDSFYRTKNVEGIGGTGLGLAIVKRAVTLHKGEITVSSELNLGSIFTVKIPKNS